MGNLKTGLPSNIQGHWVAVLTTCDFTLRKQILITLEIKKKGSISYCCSWPHGCRSRKWCDHMPTLEGNYYSDITVFGDTRQSGKFKQYTPCGRRCILISFKRMKHEALGVCSCCRVVHCVKTESNTLRRRQSYD